MVEKNRVIKVTNRDRGSVGYTLPEFNNMRRQFQPGETKEVTFEELEQLEWIPGGDYLIRNCLVIHDPEAVKELINSVEPEYYYTKDDVIKLMQSGTLDQFLDCLDFAPDGVKDMIKDLAVSLPLNDVAKRNAIREKLGFDVDNAIRILESVNEEPEKEETHSKRRANPINEETKPARRSKYTITSKEN